MSQGPQGRMLDSPLSLPPQDSGRAMLPGLPLEGLPTQTPAPHSGPPRWAGPASHFYLRELRPLEVRCPGHGHSVMTQTQRWPIY